MTESLPEYGNVCIKWIAGKLNQFWIVQMIMNDFNRTIILQGLIFLHLRLCWSLFIIDHKLILENFGQLESQPSMNRLVGTLASMESYVSDHGLHALDLYLVFTDDSGFHLPLCSCLLLKIYVKQVCFSWNIKAFRMNVIICIISTNLSIMTHQCE